MKRSLFNKWIKALESGKFKQTTKKLGNSRDGYCCLAILCKVAEVKFKGSRGTLPYRFAISVGMTDEGSSLKGNKPSLASLNDSGRSFKQIAVILRRNPLRFIKSLDP